MDQFDVTIIGAGVIGLSIAAELSRCEPSLEILVLEKNDSFGMETSSRSSEVIHAGIYYPAGLLKSRFCREGNTRLYEYCRQRNIPHRRTGKIIVAAHPDEEPALAEIEAWAAANDVSSIVRLTSKEVGKLEPAVKACSALLSESTGIIDSRQLMRSFFIEAQSAGTTFAFRSTAVSINRESSGYSIEVHGGHRIASRAVVNSAGLHADRVAAIAGFDIDLLGYRLKPCKGSYFTASPAPRLDRLVYPVPAPTNESLGIHATIDLGGRVRFGPDVEYVREIEYSVDAGKRDAFFEAVHKYLPGISRDSLHPDMSGVRPKLQGPGEPYRDFVIEEESRAGFPGFVNLVGIESPGLTSCIPIAGHVCCLVLPCL